MFLKAFREKSNKDFVNKLLQNSTGSIHDKKLHSIGVLLNQEEFDDAEAFTDYFKELGLKSPKNTVIYFSSVLTNEERLNTFSSKDFGWRGKVKNQSLMEFIEEPFDVLIGYYNADILQMHQIIAMSKANLKVGVHQHDERLFDIILNLSVIRFDIFKEEFKKYLTILKKL
jgi:hypothetical protein